MNDANSNKTIKGIEEKNDDVVKGSLGDITYPDRTPQEEQENTDDSKNDDDSKDKK